MLDILADEAQAHGLMTMNMLEGTRAPICANAVIITTISARRVYPYNTNVDIITDNGMSNNISLRDMEFVQYYPTGLPTSGSLMTESCRSEGNILINKDDHSYLQDYSIKLEKPASKLKNKYIELDLRDKVFQVF